MPAHNSSTARSKDDNPNAAQRVSNAEFSDFASGCSCWGGGEGSVCFSDAFFALSPFNVAL